jgi:hypothetical protein
VLPPPHLNHHHLTSLLIPRLSITALAADNARGYVLVAVNDRQRHVHVVDLYNEVRLLQIMPPQSLMLLLLDAVLRWSRRWSTNSPGTATKSLALAASNTLVDM